MNRILVFVVLVLLFLVLAQILKINKISKKINNDSDSEVNKSDYKLNSFLLIVFYLLFMGSSVYLMFSFGNKPGFGASASEHGKTIDNLYILNWIILAFVFYIIQFLLFFFVFKFKFNKNRKATYLSHSNKLEAIWTILPAIALAVIIITGLTAWNKINDFQSNEKESQIIEIYAKQFDWTVRYSGDDNTLGMSDFKVISPKNQLGILTKDIIKSKKQEWLDELNLIDEKLLGNEAKYFSKIELSKLENNKDLYTRQLKRLETLEAKQTSEMDNAAKNDIIVKELYLLKGKNYIFKFRSRDVIHSAYFPHFRAQMNCVPGMTTRIQFRPIVSTKDMRKDPKVIETFNKINAKRLKDGKDKVEFDYYLMCNKICGKSHYNMRLNIVVVDTNEEYMKWYKTQKESKTLDKLLTSIE